MRVYRAREAEDRIGGKILERESERRRWDCVLWRFICYDDRTRRGLRAPLVCPKLIKRVHTILSFTLHHNQEKC